MPDESSHSGPFRRRSVLRSVRRRIRRVEVETHRIESELALIESANEHAIAEELSDELVDEGVTPPALRKSRAIDHEIHERDEQESDVLTALPAPEVGGDRREPVVMPGGPLNSFQSTGTGRMEYDDVAVAGSEPAAPLGALFGRPQPPDEIGDGLPTAGAPVDTSESGVAGLIAEDGAREEDAAPRVLGMRVSRWASPAWVVSAAVHVAILLVCASLTSALLVSDYTPMDVSAVEIDLQPPEVLVDTPPPLDSTDISAVSELSEVAAVGDPLATLTENFGDDLLPLANAAPVESASGSGTLNAMPSDIGTLMVGVGDSPLVGSGNSMLPGGGSGGKGRGGRKGGAANGKAGGKSNFFGTEAVGDRIVFLLDNSGSMKQGRMETTVMELLRSIDSLNDKQMFYVVFYSDQAYPMFYPNAVMQMVPATRENKQKLAAWAPTIELCMGGELTKAMEFAASLHPSVVYVLSDGDIGSPRTMQRLTEANEWDFVVHTLGMGVKKPTDAQNLTAISSAHRGTFQMVGPTPAAIAHARTNPLRSNRAGVAWGTSGAGMR